MQSNVIVSASLVLHWSSTYISNKTECCLFVIQVVENVPTDHVEVEDAHEAVYITAAVKTETPRHLLCLENIVDDPRAVQYYTGLDNVDSFRYVLGTLGVAAYHLNYRWGTPRDISVENQFLR